MLMWCQQKGNLETKWFLLKQTNQMVQASLVLMTFSANPILGEKAKCVKANNHKCMMCVWGDKWTVWWQKSSQRFYKGNLGPGVSVNLMSASPPSACRLGAFIWNALHQYAKHTGYIMTFECSLKILVPLSCVLLQQHLKPLHLLSKSNAEHVRLRADVTLLKTKGSF